MQLKKINPKTKLYHHFELSTSQFALYDDEMDMPVVYGSRNLVDATIRNLTKSTTIIYYKRDLVDKLSFKKKATYTPETKDGA